MLYQKYEEIVLGFIEKQVDESALAILKTTMTELDKFSLHLMSDKESVMEKLELVVNEDEFIETVCKFKVYAALNEFNMVTFYNTIKNELIVRYKEEKVELKVPKDDDDVYCFILVLKIYIKPLLKFLIIENMKEGK